MKYILSKLIILSTFCFLFFSCGTSKNNSSSGIVDSLQNSPIKDNRETTITVDNPTEYNAYIESDLKIQINKKSKTNKISLLVEDATLSSGFNIFYEIPLSNSVSLICRGDHRTFRENQSSFVIAEPRITENYGTFITIHNRVNNAITFNSGGTTNPLWEQKGNPVTGNNLTWTDKREFSPGETAVYKIDTYSSGDNYFILDSGKNISLTLPQKIENNYRYSFEYSRNALELVDARPLNRIGEESWTKTINNAVGSIHLAASDGEIHLFASTNSSVIRNVYDSAGNEKTIPSGEAFTVTYSNKTGDNFIISGYEKLSNGNFRPVARIQNTNGATQSKLTPSDIYSNARFLTAAQKDNTTWLLAGDGEKKGTIGYLAYARMAQLVNDELKAVWEISPDNKCGDIKSVIYDNSRNCWFVTGENLEFDSMKNQIIGSYIAQLSEDGNIHKLDNSFKNMSFYKLLSDANGNCYLAGEEQRGSETYAILVKYTIDKNNKSVSQKISTQADSHSYYYDALLDNVNNLIILCGVMKAADGSGRGGVPFVEAIDLQTGKTKWREELTNSEIKNVGAVLVTSIIPAPDYGFALALSGIGSTTGYIEKPYMIARVNSQGKYIKEAKK